MKNSKPCNNNPSSFITCKAQLAIKHAREVIAQQLSQELVGPPVAAKPQELVGPPASVKPQELVGPPASAKPQELAGPPASAKPQEYIVRPGDSLAGIAKQFGFKSWQDLHKLNPQIKDPNQLVPGQVVRVKPQELAGPPASAKLQHTIKPGDSLAGIAKQFGFKNWQDLYKLNPQIKDPNQLAPGQVVKLK